MLGYAGPTKNRSCIRRAAAEARADRYPLRQSDSGAPVDEAERLLDKVVVRKGAEAEVAHHSVDHCQAGSCREGESVRQVDGDHLGIELVKAVRSNPGDPQRQRQLGWSRFGRRPTSAIRIDTNAGAHG